METTKPEYYLITSTWLGGKKNSWPVPAGKLKSWLAFEKSLRNVIETVYEPTTYEVYNAWWNPPMDDDAEPKAVKKPAAKKAPAKKAVAKKAVKKAAPKKAPVKKPAVKKKSK